jgi:hypothetical protein
MKRFIITLLILVPFITLAQSGIYVKKTVSDLSIPQIIWQTTLKVDSNDFHIYRATIKEKIFQEINTSYYFKPSDNSDTLELVIFDTTLTDKTIYLYYLKANSKGKTITSETAMAHNFGYIPSPQIILFKGTPLTDRKAVKLIWKLSYPQTVSSLELYRSNSYDTGYIKVADLAGDMNDYIDVIPVANEPWFYSLVIHTYFGNVITSVRIPAYATFAEKPFKPHNIHGAFSNNSIILDWTNVGKNIVGYRVYRSIGDRPFLLINNMGNGIGEKIIFTDTSEEVKTGLKLSYYVRNVSDGFVESNSSDTLSFYLVEHELVLPPEQVDYVLDKNENPKFMWVQPKKGYTTGYNVYMTSPDGKTIKLTDTVLANNSFTDTVYRSQGKYKYEFEGVGFKNKTSDLKFPIVIYRYNPRIHIIIDLKKSSNGIAVSWKHPLNAHIKKLLLYKQSGKTKPVLLNSYPPDKDISVTDKNVTKGNTYLYSLKAQMVNGDEIIINEGVQMSY